MQTERTAFDRVLFSVTSFRDGVRLAFRERSDVANLDVEGAGTQAWAAYARQLGIDQAEFARNLAPVFSIEAVESLETIDPAVLEQVSVNLCQRHTIIPVRREGSSLVVATANPTDYDLSDRLTFMVGMPIRWVLAPPGQIEDAVVVAYSKEAARAAGKEGHGSAEAGNAAAVDDNAIVRLTNGLFAKALDLRASDLHIQPFMGAAVARIRVDGAMRRLTMLTDAIASTVIRHVKARAGMDSSNVQIPQDGRLSIVVNGREYDLRISTLPAAKGERLVIRFLSQGQVHRLSSSGFSLAALQTLRRAIKRPAGMIVFTGPTGSGKTSTLYGMLAEINRSDVNIITVENPVEYRVAGISQVEVNEKAGRTFGRALRSIMRQDPDVILIGEIRDRETAEIAAQAAMTGHLVLTTLHTNDAMTAVPRLLNLGVESSVLADSLAVIAAQRLCRTLCPKCRIAVSDPMSPEESLFTKLSHNRPAYRAVGCEACESSGYKGRLPIVDIIEMNKKLRDAIAAGESRLSVLEDLREGGLQSLAASGSLRVISGDTTVREIMDTVGPTFWGELSTHYGTYFASETAESIPMEAAQGFGVLLIGDDPAVVEWLRPAIVAEGMRLVVAPDPKTAGEMLHKDEDVAFIVGDVPEGTSQESAAQMLSQNRRHISWARLPAAVLLPASLSAGQSELRGSGTMAAFFFKPVDAHDLVVAIRRAQAR